MSVVNWKLHLRTVSHHVTWFLGVRLPQTIPLVFVVGYPRSGTTWVCQLVADYLQLPFSRFSLLPVGCPAVVHGHERVRKNYPKCVYVMRDGRDALVSQYFHLAQAIPDGDNPRLTTRQRRTFPGLTNKANVHDNITAFVERLMTRPESARANWGKHVQSYYDSENPNVVLLRYEELLADGERALGRAMTQLTGEEANPKHVRESVNRFSFERQADRRPGVGQRSGFLRKGLVGDWANYFTAATAEVFNRECGDMLVRAGYEDDRSWITRHAEAAAATASGSET